MPKSFLFTRYDVSSDFFEKFQGTDFKKFAKFEVLYTVVGCFQGSLRVANVASNYDFSRLFSFHYMTFLMLFS